MEVLGEKAENAIEILEEGLKAADPYEAVLKTLKLKGSEVFVRDLRAEVKGRVFVVGAGKASGRMAEAVESILGELINEGIVIVPRGTANRYKVKRIHLWEADHPIPSKSGVEGASRILELVRELKEDDVLIVLISGGGSALMPLPANDISIEEKQKLTDLLLKSGASIEEINTVRKHVSRIKGGWLAYNAYPATVVSLIISDVVGDPMNMIASGPTVPDPTTFKDAYKILTKYGLLDRVPSTIRGYIEEGVKGAHPETPKPGSKVFSKVYNTIIASNNISLSAMKKKANSLGYNAIILTSFLEGEAREVGSVVASIGKEILVHDRPVKKPAVVLFGGETTVTIRGHGRGGRNQELILSAAIKIKGLKDILIASIGSDGIDGVTDAAGAMVDGETVLRAERENIDPEQYLLNNDSYTFFKKVGGLVYTGPTGTNVNDFTMILIK